MSQEALLQKDYALHLMGGTPESEYRVLEDLAGMKVDGIIHFPLNTGVEYINYLKQLSIPFIGVNEQNAMNQAVAYGRL